MNPKILIIVNDHNTNEIEFYTLPKKYIEQYPKLVEVLEQEFTDVLVQVDERLFVSIDDDYVACDFIGSGDHILIDLKDHISKVIYYDHF